MKKTATQRWEKKDMHLVEPPKEEPIIIFQYLPIPPSVNAAYKPITDFHGKRKVISSKELKAFKVECRKWHMMHQKECINANLLLKGADHIRIAVYVCLHDSTIYTKKREVRCYDVQNRLKNILDAVADMIGKDDKHFTSVHIQKVLIPDDVEEHCVVRIKPHDLKYF